MATAPIDPNAPQYIYRPPQQVTVDTNQGQPAVSSASTHQASQTAKTQTAAAPKATSQSTEVQDQPPPPPPPPTVNTSGQLTGTTLSITA